MSWVQHLSRYPAVRSTLDLSIVTEHVSVQIPNMPVDLHKFIERRPALCGGEPVVTGSRVTLRTILASLAEGASIEEVVADFPTVSAEAVRAIVAYAAASAVEDLPLPPMLSPA